jgi:hypothetical protein
VDEVIFESTGKTLEEVLVNHLKYVRRVLGTLKEHLLIVDPRKANKFLNEVEFSGHILREGMISPAPGKLFPNQKWELPQTKTELRKFLGLIKFSSCYVHN